MKSKIVASRGTMLNLKQCLVAVIAGVVLVMVIMEVRMYESLNHTTRSNQSETSSFSKKISSHNSTYISAELDYTIYSKRYPYIPYSLVNKCGLSDYTSIFSNKIKHQPLSHSLAFIKPHKTGSSTIAGIVNRIVDGRNLDKLIPADLTYLGWPKQFPGNVDSIQTIMNITKYDAFSNHAILNTTSIKKYLKDPIFTFTILREPISRTISSYYYFDKALVSLNINSWRDYINYIKKTKQIKFWHHGALINNLAFATGWYEFQNNKDRSTKLDHNETAINLFIQQLDVDLDLVMILENTVESLILLHDQLPNLDITELIWHDFKVGESSSSSSSKKQKVYPTDGEKRELEELLHVDRMIYNHFQKKLIQKWQDRMEKNPTGTKQIKDGFICLHDEIQLHLNDESIVSKQLKDVLTRDSPAYTKALKLKQHVKYGIPL